MTYEIYFGFDPLVPGLQQLLSETLSGGGIGLDFTRFVEQRFKNPR
jgi:hypothetical protein